MFVLARFVAVIFIVAGCILMLRPDMVKRLIEYVKEGSRIYAVGVLRIIVGLILMSVSPQSRITWVVFLLGLLAAASGIAIFVLKKENSLRLADRILSGPADKLNRLGLIPLLLGILLFCAL